MIEHLPDMIDAGIDSLKVEGRMKTALYVATVARAYRKAIDDYFEDPKRFEENKSWYLDQISDGTYRQFTTGFFYGKPDEYAQIYDANTYIKTYTYLGTVEGMDADGCIVLTQKNKFCVGDEIEIMKPDGENIAVTVRSIRDDEGNEMESAPHPKQKLHVDIGMPAEKLDILRQAAE